MGRRRRGREEEGKRTRERKAGESGSFSKEEGRDIWEVRGIGGKKKKGKKGLKKKREWKRELGYKEETSLQVREQKKNRKEGSKRARENEKGKHRDDDKEGEEEEEEVLTGWRWELGWTTTGTR